MIKRFFTKLGGAIATLTMINPIFIVHLYATESIKNLIVFVFLMIASISYDFFMYSIIVKENDMEDASKCFQNVVSGKAPLSKTEEEKLQWYKTICLSIFTDNKKK